MVWVHICCIRYRKETIEEFVLAFKGTNILQFFWLKLYCFHCIWRLWVETHQTIRCTIFSQVTSRIYWTKFKDRKKEGNRHKDEILTVKPKLTWKRYWAKSRKYYHSDGLEEKKKSLPFFMLQRAHKKSGIEILPVKLARDSSDDPDLDIASHSCSWQRLSWIRITESRSGKSKKKNKNKNRTILVINLPVFTKITGIHSQE